jgi:hypothetical protein
MLRLRHVKNHTVAARNWRCSVSGRCAARFRARREVAVVRGRSFTAHIALLDYSACKPTQLSTQPLVRGKCRASSCGDPEWKWRSRCPTRCDECGCSRQRLCLSRSNCDGKRLLALKEGVEGQITIILESPTTLHLPQRNTYIGKNPYSR